MESKSEDIKHIDLNHDITQTELMNLLNKKFGQKTFSTKTGEPVKFNQQDIQGYVSRKQLPLKYGGYKIKVIKPHNGIVLLRIKDINKVMSMPDIEI